MNSTFTNVTKLPFQPATKIGFISLTITAVVLFFGGLLSNGYVCYIIRGQKHLWRRSHEYMLFHLSLADMFTSTFGVFSQWHLFFNLFYNGIPTTTALCHLEYFFNSFGLMASAYMVLAFGLARYITIVRHATYVLTRQLAKRMVLCTWAISFAISSPALFVYTGKQLSLDGTVSLRCYYAYREEKSAFDKRIRLYLVFLALTMIIIPFNVIAFTYWKIIGFVLRWRRAKSRPGWVTSFVELRSLKIAVLIMVSFVLCFAFYAIGLVYNLAGFTSEIFGKTNEHILIAKLLASFNSCINPWIYVIINQKRHGNIVRP